MSSHFVSKIRNKRWLPHYEYGRELVLLFQIENTIFVFRARFLRARYVTLKISRMHRSCTRYVAWCAINMHRVYVFINRIHRLYIISLYGIYYSSRKAEGWQGLRVCVSLLNWVILSTMSEGEKLLGHLCRHYCRNIIYKMTNVVWNNKAQFPNVLPLSCNVMFIRFLGYISKLLRYLSNI